MTQTVQPVQPIAPAAAPAGPPAPSIRVERSVPVAVRDGTVLRADDYRPRAPGRYPVLVERTAYDLVLRLQEHGEYFAARGYVYVAQSVRGRFASEGEYRLFDDDGWGANRDGYDTVEWAAAQPWGTGDVGMLGGSYPGHTQYALPAAGRRVGDRFVDEHLAVADLQVEGAAGVGADPRLVAHLRPLAAGVRQGHQVAPAVPPARRDRRPPHVRLAHRPTPLGARAGAPIALPRRAWHAACSARGW
jgi:hypothetical protein